MNLDSADQSQPGHIASGGSELPPARRRGGRLHRLMLKELREILRDRRTIFTLALMPLFRPMWLKTRP